MGRKDYEAIARGFRVARIKLRVFGSMAQEHADEACAILAEQIAEALAINPGFDRARFLEACMGDKP